MPAWRMLLAALVLVALGAGLVYAVVVNGQGVNATPTLATAPPSTVGSTVGSTVAATVTLATTTTTTALSPVATSTTFTTPPVVVALQEALSAWGEFAVTGRMRDLGDFFVVGGPQRRQLREEADAILANPPGPPAYIVSTDNIFTISVTPSDVVLRTEIKWAREGEETQFFVWDIQMQLVDGAWQLFTVEEVQDGS